ncbi:DEP domain-containing protein 7 [Eucyclogobius newberryi]|uniref:DEP domain-containing protein 7 n=1 Tax=Eucyclogobius newberryi TaxID=166745 RepID=UPI003B59BEDB
MAMAGKPFRATYIWGSIISNLHTHVEVKRRRHNLKSYHDCFLGSEAVDAVLTHITLMRFFGEEAVPRYKAVRLCQALMDSRVFEPVGNKVVFGKDKKQPTFEDSSCSLYRFLGPGTSSLNHMSSEPNDGGYDSPGIKRNKNSPIRERQEVTHGFFMKSATDMSLEEVLGNLDLSTNVTPQMIDLGLSQDIMDEMWHQQAVFRLLQLIELPLLESLLEGKGPSESKMSTSSDTDVTCTSSYLDREVLKAFSEAQADDWMSAAVDCLEFVPDELVVELSRGLARCADDLLQCKKLLYQILAQHYGHTQQTPLLSNHIFDIHSGISELLVNGKQEQALEALQLSLKIQDSQSREELRRLLRFMSIASTSQELKLHKEIENRMAVKRSFSSAIVYSRRLPKGKVDLMVLFMMDKHHDLFKIPLTLHKLVTDKIIDIVKGEDPNNMSDTTYCNRISAKEYAENTQKNTKEELLSLLQTIHENPHLSANERRRLLGQFYKGHPEIFVQYFGNRLSAVNMLLR